MNSQKNKKILIILIAVLAFGILTPLSYSKAADIPFYISPAGWAISKVFNVGLGDIVVTFVQKVMLFFLQSVSNVVFFLIGAVAKGIDFVVTIGGNSYPDAVKNAWKLLRDFVNMFFIIGLIVMAGATIFDKEEYSYKSTLAGLIFAAVFINFSFVIGAYLISLADGLSHLFLGQIGSISERLANGFNVAGVALGSGSENTNKAVAALATDALLIQAIIAVIFLLVFMGVTLLAMLSILALVFIRIPILWGLLILSPFAWVGYIFPKMKSETWSKWWQYFNSWAFFTPVYLFFLSLGFIILNAKPKTQAIDFDKLAGSSTATIFATIFGFQDILFYMVTLFFVFGGFFAAFKVGSLAGNGVSTAFNKIHGSIKQFAARTSGYSAAKAGVQQRAGQIKEQVKETGLPGKLGFFYGGERAQRLKTAGVAQFLGDKGAYGRQKLQEAEKEKAKLKTEFDLLPAGQRKAAIQTELNTRKGGAAGNAALLLAAENGISTEEDYLRAMGRFGGENSALGRKYLDGVKSANFAQIISNPEEAMAIASGKSTDFQEFIGLRRALAEDLGKNNQITNEGDFIELKKIFEGLPKELKSFTNSIKPEYIYGAKDKRQKALVGEGTDPVLAKKLILYMGDKDRNELTDKDGKLLERALSILGGIESGASEERVKEATLRGRDTYEGREIINVINKSNPLIVIKQDLGEGATPESIKEVLTNNVLNTRTNEELAKLTPEFYNDPIVQEAFMDTFKDSPERVAEIIKRAPKKVKEAIPLMAAKKKEVATPTPKRKAGFV